MAFHDELTSVFKSRQFHMITSNNENWKATNMKSLITSLAILACLPLAVLNAEDTSRADLVGRQIPNFVLPSVTGKEIALADFPEVDFLVIVFLMRPLLE